MYAKIFTSMYQGTLRGNAHGLLVFTNLLAHSDRAGQVDIHPKAIAEEVGLTVDQVRETLIMLESPDDESRSPEDGGRRIIRLDEHRAWGWIIVNYQKYRALRNEDDRREQNRKSQETWRKKNKQNKPSISTVSLESATSAHADVEVEVEAEVEVDPVVTSISKETPVLGQPKKNGKHATAVYIHDAESVFKYLNEAIGSNFQLRNPKGAITANGELVMQRLREGYSAVQLREVIFDRCEAWEKDPKMREFLRPSTLFSKTNFEKYLGAL